MKKKVLTMVVALAMLATMLPMTAMAASTNEKKLNKIKVSDIATYDTALPTNGKKKTLKQIDKLLGKLNYKPRGSGSTWYSARLYFYKSNYDESEGYTSASVDKGWSMYNESNQTSYYYSESKDLIARYGNEKLTTRRHLSKTTSKKYTYFDWEKGAQKGTKTTGKVKTGGGGSSKDTRRNFVLYKDEKVLGEKCMVYSYQYKGDSATYYQYVSRKTGRTMKTVYASDYGKSTNIYFEGKNVNKATSFYKEPKSVTFVKNKQSSAAMAEAQVQEAVLGDYFAEFHAA